MSSESKTTEEETLNGQPTAKRAASLDEFIAPKMAPELTMESFHIGISPGRYYISADINVPGLGKVTIKDCVSRTTIEAIEKEVVFACRQKMGQAT